MRWAQPRVPDIKGVFDKFQIFNRVLQRNVALLWAYGSPCISWRNSAITPTGTFPSGALKCYCWSTPTDGGGSSDITAAQPDRFHFLCGGTGILDVDGKGGGYQRYGYREHIFSTPSTLTRSTNDLIIGGDRKSNYFLSGVSLNGTLTTEKITFDKFKSVDYVLMNDTTNAAENRIDYLYNKILCKNFC